MPESPTDKETLADRLNLLFSYMHPQHRGPYTATEVADAIESSGAASLSAEFLQSILDSRVTEVPPDVIDALGTFFFGAPSPWLTAPESEPAALDDLDVKLLAAVSDPEVSRLVVRYIGPDKLAELLADLPVRDDADDAEHES